jgi:hypothetical protein
VNVRRFRIAWVMVLVAFAALDLAAIRAVVDHRGSTRYLLGIGAIPMANVLVAGLLVGRWRRESRRFLIGFEAFGAMACAAYVISASLFARETLIPYIWLVHTPIISFIDATMPLSRPFYFLVYYFVLAVLLGLPLVAFALVGGFFCRGLATANGEVRSTRDEPEEADCSFLLDC